MKPENVLLSGIVGSTAYGLAREGSDVDRLGVYAEPTDAFLGLRPPVEKKLSIVQHDPSDVTIHEVGKFCRLALNVNPTITELLWLPADLYEVRTTIGYELIGLRTKFLSARRVRDAYLGYAAAQFHRLEVRGDGSFSADTRKRTAKHSRHLLRLCWQGLHLYRTGELLIRVDDPDDFHDFGERVAAGDIEAARRMLASYESDFDADPTPLPALPDEVTIDRWLRRVRAHYWKEVTDDRVRQFPQSQHRDAADDPR